MISIGNFISFIQNECFADSSKTNIGEQWKQIQSERWLNPAFEEFINKEIIPTVKENKRA
jgi:hypothetical protein